MDIPELPSPAAVANYVSALFFEHLADDISLSSLSQTFHILRSDPDIHSQQAAYYIADILNNGWTTLTHKEYTRAHEKLYSAHVETIHAAIDPECLLPRLLSGRIRQRTAKLGPQGVHLPRLPGVLYQVVGLSLWNGLELTPQFIDELALARPPWITLIIQRAMFSRYERPNYTPFFKLLDDRWTPDTWLWLYTQAALGGPHPNPKIPRAKQSGSVLAHIFSRLASTDQASVTAFWEASLPQCETPVCTLILWATVQDILGPISYIEPHFLDLLRTLTSEECDDLAHALSVTKWSAARRAILLSRASAALRAELFKAL